MAEELLLRRVLCGAYEENAWLVGAAGEDTAVLIDPGDGLAELRAALAASGRRLGAILLTHGHFDHTLAAGPLARESGAPVYVHPADLAMVEDARLNAFNPMAADLPCPADVGAEVYPVSDGEIFSACGLSFRLMHTPGHTPGSVCLYDADNGLLFSGDTLFAMGYGRTDLPGGSDEEMSASLLRLFTTLPGTTRVLSGHGKETSIGREAGYYRF